MGSSRVPVFHQSCLATPLPKIFLGFPENVPTRLASNGLMSKMSMPCIFPRISRRSRPVACSRSVGTVPGFAPGPTRSASVLISVGRWLLAIGVFLRESRRPGSQLGSAIGGQQDGSTYGRASCSPQQRWGSSRSGRPPCPRWPSRSHRLQWTSEVHRMIELLARLTADESGGEGAAGEGARGGSSGEGEGRALDEHGGRNGVWSGEGRGGVKLQSWLEVQPAIVPCELGEELG